MRLRQTLFVVLLLYVMVDLSVPVVGGAFVFEASESAEAVRVARPLGAPVLAAAPRVPDPVTEEPARGHGLPVVAPPTEAPRRFRLVPHRPRAALSPTSSPDAH
ncbi:MAG TPA: hypothetical protein VF136_19915 [Methylomirabilota bacterium]